MIKFTTFTSRMRSPLNGPSARMLDGVNRIQQTKKRNIEGEATKKEKTYKTRSSYDLQKLKKEKIMDLNITKKEVKVEKTNPSFSYTPKNNEKKMYTSYSKFTEVKYVTIGIASPLRILQWAEKTLPNGKIYGEVLNANTLHHKTFKPQKGGLFCERIFGPLKDFTCACGKVDKSVKNLDKHTKTNEKNESGGNKNLNLKNEQNISSFTNTKIRKFCPDCDVEYTWSVIRRYQLGYIRLMSPVTHLWFLKGTPSYLSIFLDMKKRHLQSIVYCTETMTLEQSFHHDSLKNKFNNLAFFSPKQIFLTWQQSLPKKADTLSGSDEKNKDWQKGKGNETKMKTMDKILQKRLTIIKNDKQMKKEDYIKKNGLQEKERNNKRKVSENNILSSLPMRKASGETISTTLGPVDFYIFCKNEQNIHKKTIEYAIYSTFKKLLKKAERKALYKALISHGNLSLLQNNQNRNTEKEFSLKDLDYRNTTKPDYKTLRIVNTILSTLYSNRERKSERNQKYQQRERKVLYSIKEILYTIRKKVEKKFKEKALISLQSLNKNNKSIQTKKKGGEDHLLVSHPSIKKGRIMKKDYERLYKSYLYGNETSGVLYSLKTKKNQDNKITPRLLTFDGTTTEKGFYSLTNDIHTNNNNNNNMNNNMNNASTKQSILMLSPFLKLPGYFVQSKSQRIKIKSLKLQHYLSVDTDIFVNILTFALLRPLLLHLYLYKRSKLSSFNLQYGDYVHLQLNGINKTSIKFNEIKSYKSMDEKNQSKGNIQRKKMIEELYSMEKENGENRENREIEKTKGNSSLRNFIFILLRKTLSSKEQKENSLIMQYKETMENKEKNETRNNLSSERNPPIRKTPNSSNKKWSIQNLKNKAIPQNVLLLSKRLLSLKDVDKTSIENTYGYNRHSLMRQEVKAWLRQMSPSMLYRSDVIEKETKEKMEKGEGSSHQLLNTIKTKEGKKKNTILLFFALKNLFLKKSTKTKTLTSTLTSTLTPMKNTTMLGPKYMNQQNQPLNVEESGLEGSSGYLQKKEKTNKRLYNNFYTVSHRERWGIQQNRLMRQNNGKGRNPPETKGKDWLLFSLYSTSQDPFAVHRIKNEEFDFPIYVYKKRIYSNPNSSYIDESSMYGKNEKKWNKGFYNENTESSSFNIRTFFSGPGMVQHLLNEYSYNEIKKLDKQNRLLLYQFNKSIFKLKKQKEQLFFDKKKYMEIKELCKKRDLLIRRTKLVRMLYRKNSSPSYMILTVLPVLPPDLRPIVKMSSQILASDLNRLYQRVIYRNDRLKKFLKDPATSHSILTSYAQRLLQEAVDNLISNGKGGVVAEKDARGRALKSLSEILKGKQGRFRQFLLGKRVDYSGRSVIVVGPKLKLHECGIPVEMALELFTPFLIKTILNKNIKRTVVGAKTLIKNNRPLALSLLREIMQVTPVLLNRAPTLHRLGFQAFIPRLVEGRAILLHPLVCAGFNADFDGDQMGVHVPITTEARAEAWKLMLSINNVLSPATGEPLAIPSQDMVLGCYYLTTNGNKNTLSLLQRPEGSGLFFNTFNSVLFAYSQQQIDIHAQVWVKWNGFMGGVVTNANEREEAIEIRLDHNGNIQEISNQAIRYYQKNNTLISQYICTTPGRILFNNFLRNCFN